jgi:hypothetical protein
MRTISREQAVQKMLHSNGRMFTVIWKRKDGKERKANCKLAPVTAKQRSQNQIFGYVTVMDAYGDGFKRVNCRTISRLNIDRNQLVIK